MEAASISELGPRTISSSTLNRDKAEMSRSKMQKSKVDSEASTDDTSSLDSSADDDRLQRMTAAFRTIIEVTINF